MNADSKPAYVLLDDALTAAAAARISATSEGFLYGHGVFETIKVLGGRPVFLREHHARLLRSTRDVELVYTVDLATLHARLLRLIAANGVVDGSTKVVVFNNDDTAGELITTRGGLYPADVYARGFRLNTFACCERTDGLSGHKTLNYLANIRARRSALAAGFDEALFVTPAGFVIEGAATNLFMVKDGVALTPPLASGPLPGIARSQVLALSGSLRARESAIDLALLRSADEVFMTNALLGVMPVSRIDAHGYDLAANPFTRALQTAYHEREIASFL